MKIWLGSKYILDWPIFIAILSNVYYSIVTYPVVMFREATELYKKVRWIMLFCAIENVILSILMGKLLGTFGIIIASFISRITTIFWYEAKLLFQVLKLGKPLNYYLKLTTDAGIMLIFCYITSFIVGRIACDKLWIWGLKGVLCSTIVILLYFIRYAGNKEMKEIWMKIGSVIGKRNKK